MSDLPTLTAKQKGELLSAKARAKLDVMAEVLRELVGLGHGKIGKALANGAAKLSAAGYKMSASRLGHVLAAYRERGEFALIDHKLCGGCGLDGCTRTHGVTLLHPETVKHWLELMHENKARQTKGTIDGKASWKLLIRMLCAGETIRGLNDGRPGTWHDFYRKVKPGHPVPSICPWSTAKRNTPPGLSYQNFTAKKPEAAVMAGLNAGVGAMRNALPQVLTTREGLRFMEMVLVDDKRLDCLVVHPTRNGFELVEVNALFFMCVATGSIVWVSLHPALPRPDGSRVGITHQDVRLGFVQMIKTIGVPKYGMTWKMENATATVSDADARMIETATGGLVKTGKTGTWDSAISVFGYKERGGNPRGKARLEGFFGRMWDVQFGFHKGQTGPRYQLQPGELARMIQDANRTLKAVGALVTEAEIAKIVPTFPTMTALRESILATLDVIQNDPLHDREGFPMLTLWRNAPDEPWKDETHPMIQTLASMGGAAAVNDFLARLKSGDKARELVCVRKQTVMERRRALYDPAQFLKPDMLALWEMLADTFSAVYEGGNVLRVNTGKAGFGWLEFHGSMGIEHRCKVQVRMDLTHPQSGAWVFGPDGKLMTHLELRERSGVLDSKGIAAQLKLKHEEGDRALQRLRDVVDSPAAMQRRIEAATERAGLLIEIADEATGGELTASPQAKALAAAMREDPPDEDEDEGLTEFEQQRYADDDE